MVEQLEIKLPPYKRGIHIITAAIEAQLPALPEAGIINIFLRHTSAGITLNENADPTVRSDLNDFLDRIAPDDSSGYRHRFEGADDMPAHIKSSLTGQSLTLPVRGGRMDLGTWQGICLCEFRNSGGARSLTVTIIS